MAKPGSFTPPAVAVATVEVTLSHDGHMVSVVAGNCM